MKVRQGEEDEEAFISKPAVIMRVSWPQACVGHVDKF
jgi:hypothetical protein